MGAADPGIARWQLRCDRRQHVDHREAPPAGELHGPVLQQRGSLRGARALRFRPSRRGGKTIGAARATIASDWLAANLAGAATIKLYAGQERLYGDLVAGRLDAVFGDGLGSYAWLQGPEGAGFEFAGEGYRLDEGIGIAVRHEDASLLSRLNRGLEVILASGAYEQINARYFPFSIH